MSRQVGIVVCLIILGLATGVVLADNIPHEHPDEVEEGDDGNPEMLQTWFADRLGGMYSDCASGLPQWDTEVCEPVEDDADSLVERYQSVEETTTPMGARRGEEFQTVRELQLELASAVVSFNSTFTEYEAAQETGDGDEMREQVVELRELAGGINETAENLNETFLALDNATAADLDTAADQVLATAENITVLTQDLEAEAFEETNLTVVADDNASFADPASVSGTLRSADGQPVTDVEITVTAEGVFDDTVTTDEDGRFEAFYRPVRAELGETEITVRYEPESADPYVQSTETVGTNVTQTATNVTITEAPTEAAFEDEITVEGVVTAAGDRPGNVSVSVLLNETEIATGETDENGSFDVTGVVSANVPSGVQSITVEASESDTALAVERESQTIEISETELFLFASADVRDDGGIQVSGELATDDALSVPAANQSVTVSIGAETWTATTDDDGEFTVDIDEPGDDSEIVVEYADPNTNLGDVAVVFQNPEEPGFIVRSVDSLVSTIAGLVDWIPVVDSSDIRNGLVIFTIWLLFVVYIVRGVPSLPVDVNSVSNAFVAVLLRGRRFFSSSVDASLPEGSNASDVTVPESVGLTEAESSAVTHEAHSPVDTVDETSLLSAARSGVDDTPARAVQLAYAAVRRNYTVEEPKTHWEAYHELQPTLPDTQRDALRSVTETFELATFTSQNIERGLAQEAISNAEKCISDIDNRQ